MGEMTTVTHSEGEDPSVLAEAAVGAAAVAGAAHERADAAAETAQSAQAKADTALSVAVSRPVGITPEEARQIAREESERYVAELAAAAKVEETPAPTEVNVTEVHEEVAPPSVAQANPDGPQGEGKRRFLDRWIGE